MLDIIRDQFDQFFMSFQSWIVAPSTWSQFLLIFAAIILAWLVNRWLAPRIVSVVTPAPDSDNWLSQFRRFVIRFVPLLLPLLAYVFTAIGENVTRAMFDSGSLIAFAKRAFLFYALYVTIHRILRSQLLRTLGRFIIIPIGVIYVLGLLDETRDLLENTVVPLGNLSFSLMWLLQLIVVGTIIFWLGQWSTQQSTSIIEQQEEMPPATRQLVSKAVEFFIMAGAFLILMNIMDINMTSLAVLGGAVGVGLGFGLQKIASNFASGVILLIEGQATVGDYVELDGGEAGTIVRMMARATILETFDGKWIVVPNEDFITTRVINYSDQGSANRYEIAFTVSYDTDINQIPNLIETAVATHPEVLDEPFPPDCELRELGEYGVEFAVEFWVNGIDDGKKKYTSDVRFIVWNALRDAGIEIPYPRQVVEVRGSASGAQTA